MSKRNEYAIGVDLGGTNITAGIVNSTGKVILREKLPTLAHLGGKVVLNRISQAISCLLSKNRNYCLREFPARTNFSSR